MNNSELQFSSACDIGPQTLKEFYYELYPNRYEALCKNFKWLNRSYFFDNKIPIVLLKDDKVIAHAGMIPVRTLIDGESFLATWYIDFAVLPAFHRKGLGALITKKYTEFSDIQLALSCNDMFIAVFRKLGWKESPDTYLHINFLAPFSYPGIVRRFPPILCKIFNLITQPFLYLNYKLNLISHSDSKIEDFDEDIMKDFMALYNETIHKNDFNNTLNPIRDNDFVNWRLMNSPGRGKYKIYSSMDFKALILCNNNHGSYIDVLWVTNISDIVAIKSMISYLALYGMKRGYSYIRFYTTHRNLSVYLKKKLRSYVRNPRFAYFSKNSDLLKRMGKVEWNWELIDNDFERIY